MHVLPHEVADLQPVLDLLSRQDPTDPEVTLVLLTLGKNNRYLKSHLIFLLTNFLPPFVAELGNPLHSVVMAVNDLPHTL